VISHDTALLDVVVNKVFHLDSDTTSLDMYHLGWSAYLQQRETDARRRRRENASASRQAAVLQSQADKSGPRRPRPRPRRVCSAGRNG